jgi:hypothetical protein
MTLSYTTTFRDLWAFHLHHLPRSPITIVISFGGVAFMSFLFFLGPAPDSVNPFSLPTRIVATFVFAMVVLVILIAVQLAIVALHLALRRMKTKPTDYTLTLGEDGFVEESSDARLNYQWPGVQKLARTRCHLFIYVAPSIAVIVPRRAFGGEAEWNDLYEFCRRKTAPRPTATGRAADGNRVTPEHRKEEP